MNKEEKFYKYNSTLKGDFSQNLNEHNLPPEYNPLLFEGILEDDVEGPDEKFLATPEVRLLEPLGRPLLEEPRPVGLGFTAEP